ncbi:endonuclease domain-containing protein [Gryllotalpicola ginsengisoli]|uniref:endonuclease domain-containing protein n=1 Tax=Gryllotalpicola ginsengisoli TaxID=444608 RepID=UPI0003B46006|nr:DUF559 domain-containing protein [Gryllotalpicola ginsengisoli]
MSPDQILDINIGFATREQLRDAGMSAAALRRAIAAGALVPVGKSVVARSRADPDLLRAARAGARVACVSAALKLGLWAVDDGRFHVAPRVLNSHAGADGASPDMLLHWTRHPVDAVGDLVALESMTNLLMHVAKCQPLDYAVAVFDSAVRRGKIMLGELQQLARVHGGRFRRVVALTTGLADSGVESIARVRLWLAGIVTRQQVRIDGHPVDLLIGDRLVIQLDGKQHGEDPQLARDRWQDRRLRRLGYTVLRYGYAEVLHGWQRVLDEIAMMLAQRAHLG